MMCTVYDKNVCTVDKEYKWKWSSVTNEALFVTGNDLNNARVTATRSRRCKVE